MKQLLTVSIVLGLLAGVLVPDSAHAWLIGAGWAQSDVGLDQKGDGFYVGAGNDIPFSSSMFDAAFGIDYVQKKGSQLTQFSDPVAGFTTEDAEVTLHVLQPSVTFGLSPENIPLQPRLYLGAAIGLKLSESWSDFPGQPDQAYGYKETDVAYQVGLSLGLQTFFFDVRWTKSLSGQLLVDNQETQPFIPGKAENPLAGVDPPQEGFKTETWQVGLGMNF